MPDEPRGPTAIPSERTDTADREPPPLNLAWLSLLAFGVGIITGLGAVGFRDLIGLIH